MRYLALLSFVMSSQEKKSEVSFFNANFTSIISVALLLVVLGVVAVFMIAGRNLSDSIKSNIGFTVVVSPNASDSEINDLKRFFNDSEFVASAKFVSSDDALKTWQNDTGEDLMALLGANPLNSEFDIRLRSDYASSDSISMISAMISPMPGVLEIDVQKEMVDSINRNIQKISMALLLVALALVIISFALINNTVQLSVYSKRFLIHTMKLVGATAGFIRRPFVVSSVINGIIAAVLADIIIALGLYYGSSFANEEIAVTPVETVAVLAGTFVLGIVICAIAAAISTSKYIRLDYDALFKR